MTVSGLVTFTIDVLPALLLIEAVALALLRRRSGAWHLFPQDAANIVAGLAFALALAIARPIPSAELLALLATAGAAHAAEVWLRLRSQQQGGSTSTRS